MNISEFIGFIITMLFLIFLFIKKSWEDVQRRKHPKEYADRDRVQEEKVKELLRSMNIPVDDEEEIVVEQAPLAQVVVKTKPNLPHRTVRDDFTFHTQLEDRHLESSVAKRKFVPSIEDRYAIPYGRRVASEDMGSLSALDPYSLRHVVDSSKAHQLLKRQKSLAEVILLEAIIGPPKALEHVPPIPPAHS